MAYTDAKKSSMYANAQADLTKTALALKEFIEDKDLYVDGEPSEEQRSVRRNYEQIVDMVGRFAIEAKSNEADK